MITDDEFRVALFEDPVAAIQAGGYDVTEEELEGFKEIQEDDLANLSHEELEERLSKTQCNLTVAAEVTVSGDAY
jgi:hypothetical protein